MAGNLTKRCLGCEQVKGLEEFSPHSTISDGRHPRCKECHAAARRSKRAGRVARNRRENCAIRRFLRMVSFGHGPDACWTWTGGMSGNGYGRFTWRGKTRQSHRLAYRAAQGPIPNGHEIDHLCRNRACVNPEHMEPVTHRENALRGVGFAAVNAKKTHCVHGHPYTEENTYRDPNGRRECRKCRRSQMMTYYERNPR